MVGEAEAVTVSIEGLSWEYTGSDFFLEEFCSEAEPKYRSKLLPRMREALRSRHYSRRTERTYCSWVKRFIISHGTATRAALTH